MPLGAKKSLANQTHWLRLYALPTRHGLYMALVLLSLVALGLRVQNNMLLAVVALLAVLLFLSVVWAASNMSGVSVSLVTDTMPLAGQPVVVALRLNTPRPCYGLHISAVAKRALHSSQQFSWRPSARGPQVVEPIRLESLFPLHMVRVWTHVRSHSVLVAPQPRQAAVMSNDAAGPSSPLASGSTAGSASTTAPTEHAADDSPTELRPYEQGDSLARVHWRRFMQRKQLFTRRPEARAAELSVNRLLRYSHYQHLGHEEALSALCYELLRLDSQGLPWTLELPSQIISSLDYHAKSTALQALAVA